MTFIVSNSKEGYLAADQFVFKRQDHEGCIIASTSRLTENKIRITDDNHFAYVFDWTQDEDIAPIVLGYIYRFEAGCLVREDDDFVKIVKEAAKGKEISLFVMSKRTNYFVSITKDKMFLTDNPKRTICNEDGLKAVFDVVDLTLDEIMKAAFRSNITAMTPAYDVVYAKSLKLIPKQKGKK